MLCRFLEEGKGRRKRFCYMNLYEEYILICALCSVLGELPWLPIYWRKLTVSKKTCIRGNKNTMLNAFFKNQRVNLNWSSCGGYCLSTALLEFHLRCFSCWRSIQPGRDILREQFNGSAFVKYCHWNQEFLNDLMHFASFTK